jgi:hypothetical protein
MAGENASPKTLGERVTDRLPMYVALTAAIIAALAGISSLLMGRHGGKATSQLIQASNNWNYYQAKSLKTYILGSEKNLFEAMGKDPKDDAKASLVRLEAEKTEIKAQAEECTRLSEWHGKLAGTLGDAVTLFQIAIANAAIAALARKPLFWLVSLGLGLVGAAFLAYYGLQVFGVLAVG